MTCNIKDCNNLGKLHSNGKRYLVKGYCSTHYQRLMKNGAATHEPVYIGSPGERSDTFRKNQSARMTGKVLHATPHTPETKLKISAALKGKRVGEENHMWKGGITSFNKAERRRFRRELQHKVFERDGYRCTICTNGGSIQVDHVKRWSEYPKERFNINNCRTLCMACHYKITFNRDMPKDCVWGHNLNKRNRK